MRPAAQIDGSRAPALTAGDVSSGAVQRRLLEERRTQRAGGCPISAGIVPGRRVRVRRLDNAPGWRCVIQALVPASAGNSRFVGEGSRDVEIEPDDFDAVVRADQRVDGNYSNESAGLNQYA
jgi:hypothetical protein